MNALEFKTLRKKMGYSQEDLAKIIGMTRQTIIEYEKNGTKDVLVVEKLNQLYQQYRSELVENNIVSEPPVEYILF